MLRLLLLFSTLCLVLCKDFATLELLIEWAADNCQVKTCEDQTYLDENGNKINVNPKIFFTWDEALIWAQKNCIDKECADLLVVNPDEKDVDNRILSVDVSRSKSKTSQISSSHTNGNGNSKLSQQASIAAGSTVVAGTGATTRKTSSSVDGSWGDWGNWGLGSLWGGGTQTTPTAAGSTTTNTGTGGICIGGSCTAEIGIGGIGLGGTVAGGITLGANRRIGIGWWSLPNYLRKLMKRGNNVIISQNDWNKREFEKLSQSYKDWQVSSQAHIDAIAPGASGILAGLHTLGSAIDDTNTLIINGAHKGIGMLTGVTDTGLKNIKPVFKPVMKK